MYRNDVMWDIINCNTAGLDDSEVIRKKQNRRTVTEGACSTV
jgi:hypothetical protein